MNVVEPVQKSGSREMLLLGARMASGEESVDPIADLFSPDVERREAAIPRLIDYGIASIPLLCTLVLRPLGFALGRWPEWQQMLPANAIMNRCDVARQAAMRALIGIGEPSLPQLIPMLQASELQIRVLAAEALAQMDNPVATEALETLLRDERQILQGRRMRWLLHMRFAGSAILALAGAGAIAWNPGLLWWIVLLYLGILPFWLQIPCPDSRWYLRLLALRALGRSNATRLLGALAAGLADPSADVRSAAVQGLKVLLPQVRASDREHIGRREMRLLVDALDGDDPDLAVAILGALQQIGDERILRRIAFLIDSPLHFAPVRVAAQRCLPHVKRRILASQEAQSLLRPLVGTGMGAEVANREELLRSVVPQREGASPDELLHSIETETV